MLVSEYIPYSAKDTSDILRLLPSGAEGISNIFLCWVMFRNRAVVCKTFLLITQSFLDWCYQYFLDSNGSSYANALQFLNLQTSRVRYMAQQHLVGRGLLIVDVPRLHSNTPTLTLYDSYGRVISPTQRPLPDNTQHSQQTDIHLPGGIRTLNTSKWVDADRRLRLSGDWDQHFARQKTNLTQFLLLMFFWGGAGFLSVFRLPWTLEAFEFPIGASETFLCFMCVHSSKLSLRKVCHFSIFSL